jgi:hypothetical protein
VRGGSNLGVLRARCASAMGGARSRAFPPPGLPTWSSFLEAALAEGAGRPRLVFFPTARSEVAVSCLVERTESLRLAAVDVGLASSAPDLGHLEITFGTPGG